MISALSQRCIGRLVLTRGKKQLTAASSVRNYKSSSLEDYSEDPRVDIGSAQLSTAAALSASSSNQYAFDEEGNVSSEFVSFPAVDRNSTDYNMETRPVLLNAKEHAIEYLSKILNARVYEAAIETDLQHAKNLSAVR